MAVRVNGEELDPVLIEAEREVIRAGLASQKSQADPAELEAQVQEWARENAIERLLLRQAALADPELNTPEEAGCESGALTESAIQARIDRLVVRNAGRIAAPRPKDVSEYYRKHRGEFVIPELVHAAHIVKNVDASKDDATALAEMQAIEKELDAGASFEEIADRSSDCPGRGGDLGRFPAGRMVEEFDRVVFALAPGERSPIFRTPFGYHIAKVFEKIPEHEATLEEVRTHIEAALMEEKRKRALDRLLDHLRAEAVIERS